MKLAIDWGGYTDYKNELEQIRLILGRVKSGASEIEYRAFSIFSIHAHTPLCKNY